MSNMNGPTDHNMLVRSLLFLSLIHILTVDMVTADTPEFMIEDKVARALISALYAAPHGVIAMSCLLYTSRCV